MIKIQRPVKFFKLLPVMRITCISLLFSSTVLTGCTALGLSKHDDTEQQEQEVKSSPMPHSTQLSESASPIEADTPTSAASVAHATPVVAMQQSQPDASANFKRPKAIQDMRAFSTDMIRGRYAPAEQPTIAVSQPTKATAQTVSETYSAPTIATPDSSTTEVKVISMAAATTASTTVIQSPDTTHQVTRTAINSPVPAPTAEAEKVATATATQEITAEQVNEIIEKNPTAAGVETVALLDQSKEKQTPKVTEAIARVPVEKPAKIKSDLVNKALSGKRPKAIGIWSIEEDWDGLHPGECRLSTPTIQIDQDGYATQVSFDVINGVLIVNTSTNIDISLKDVGIRFDNGSLEPFSENHFASNAVWTGNLMGALQKHNELNLVLGGSELGKRRQQATINLNDLKQAFAWYQHCNK